MLIERTTLLSCSAQRCFEEVQKSALLQQVAAPLVRFVPLEPASFPERWEPKEYLVSVRLFGFLPAGRQRINLSIRERSAEMGRFHVELRDNGRGTLASTWDHLIVVQALEQGCSYTDRVTVKAGILTPLVWSFAWIFYRHRQRRWRRLAGSGFSYGPGPSNSPRG